MRLNKPGARLRPQSRENLIDIGSDNAGFAAHVFGHADAFERLFAEHFPSTDVTVFGEWAGGNIQKGVALSETPKHFVVFGAWVHQFEDEGYYVPATNIASFRDPGAMIYNICDVPAVKLEIDFSQPHLVQSELEALVAKYEEECQWAKAIWNVSGIGEGLVWMCESRPDDSDLWFKTKGDKHANGNKVGKVRITADPEKVSFINALVNDHLLPTWRLEQGLREIAGEGVEVTSKDTGAYLKWVCNDVLKEEEDVILASGFEWKKDLAHAVTSIARQYFLAELNRRAGL